LVLYQREKEYSGSVRFGRNEGGSPRPTVTRTVLAGVQGVATPP